MSRFRVSSGLAVATVCALLAAMRKCGQAFTEVNDRVGEAIGDKKALENAQKTEIE